MRFYRIGEKVVSQDKLFSALSKILAEREAGATQEEAARRHGVQRSFVSFLESLGEIRRGSRVALLGFPVANAAEVQELAEERGVDFVLVVSQAQREGIESGSATDVFNQLLDTLAALRDYDVVVILASDRRIGTVERILGREVVGIELGHSPIRNDVEVDLAELGTVLDGVMRESSKRPRRRDRVSSALREAADIAGRWTQSKRS